MALLTQAERDALAALDLTPEQRAQLREMVDLIYSTGAQLQVAVVDGDIVGQVTVASRRRFRVRIGEDGKLDVRVRVVESQ